MTTISWTDETWNPWQGCSRVSPGCANCYMFAEREGRFGIPSGIVTRSSPATFRKPLKLKEPSKIFTCSWSDFFHEGADEWRDDAWDIIRRTPQHTYQILTKRSGRIWKHLPQDWGDGWSNVWLGVSVENQAQMHRAYALADVPARVRFISAEPLLGPLEIPSRLHGEIHWLISGGESGPRARPANPEWFRSLRDQCASMNISYWHKQNGGRDRGKGGIMLDGKIHQEFPRVLNSSRLPYGIARCKGVGYEEDGAVEWREGCAHCLRRTSPPNPMADQQEWVDPPPIITFSCYYLLEESDVRKHP